ncbi:MAG: hypothetical protein QOJ70_3572 [Acidobacteriota bacterium]|nr:hypothetical protein [Acidobacteriota bacterium]
MLKLRRMLVTCLLVSGLLNAACFKSKNVVTKVPPAGFTKPVVLNGVPYALPRTIVTVRLPFKLVEKKPGELQSYAPCFFSREVAAGRITEEGKSYSLDTPTFSSRGEPDPNEHYIAKIKGGFFENKTMELAFNNEGVITKGDASSENTAIDVAIKGARAAISVGANIAKGAAAAVRSSGAVRNLRIDEEAALQKAQMEICRSVIIAEAASNAAAKASAVAEATGIGAAQAQNASNHAKLAETKIEVAKGKLADALSILSITDNKTTDAATPTQTTALGHLNAEVNTLYNRVRTDVTNAKVEVVNLAVALGGNPKAEELRDKKKKIDAAVTFADDASTPATGFLDEAGAFLNGFLEAKKQYELLVALKEQRQSLDTGESLPQDTLKLKLDQLDAAIAAQQNTIFFGTKSEDTWAADFRFIPGKSILSAGGYNTSQTSPALLVISKKKGLCDTDEAVEQGVIIKDSFKADTCPLAPGDSEALWVRVNRVTDDDGFLGHMAAANTRDEGNGERGFYYRIPAAAVVKLESGALTAPHMTSLAIQSRQGQMWRQSNPNEAAPPVPLMPGGKEIARTRMKVAQLGVTASLPASAAGRKTQYTVEFDENTGAMKNFKLASNALLEKSLVDEAAGAANDIVGAKAARDKAKDDAAKAAAAANDPLAQKKRELDLLKTQNEINEEKKKLEASSPPEEEPEP